MNRGQVGLECRAQVQLVLSLRRVRRWRKCSREQRHELQISTVGKPEDVVSGDIKRNGRSVDFTLRCSEVDHLTVLLEHVDLLNRLNRLHIQFLQRALQLLVIGSGAFMRLFDFSPGSSFSSDTDSGCLCLEPCELGLIHDSPELEASDRLQERGYFDRCELES